MHTAQCNPGFGGRPWSFKRGAKQGGTHQEHTQQPQHARHCRGEGGHVHPAIPRVIRVLWPPCEVGHDLGGEGGGVAHGGGDGNADDVGAQEEEEGVQAGACRRSAHNNGIGAREQSSLPHSPSPTQHPPLNTTRQRVHNECVCVWMEKCDKTHTPLRVARR